MTQTTNQVWGGAAKVEISTDGSSWTDISGHSNQVNPGEQTRQTGEAYTFDGDGALLTWGKLQPVEIEVRIVYTEQASDAYKTLQTQFQTAGGGAAYLRWSPAGGSGGDYQYATGASKVHGWTFPPTQADDANPILCAFKMRAAAITQSTIAT